MPSDTEMTDVKEKAGGEPRRSERTTKLTEKGRGLRLEFLNGRFKSMVSSINDKVVAVGLLICSEEVNISEARAEVDSLRQALKEFKACYSEIVDLSGDDLDSQLVSRFTEVETNGSKAVLSLAQCIQDNLSERGSNRSRGSRGSRGSRNRDAAKDDQNPDDYGGLPDIGGAPQGNPNHESAEDKAFKEFCSKIALSRLPAPEPEVFSGDPLQYQSWKKSFNALISNKGIPNDERLYYLSRYLSGDAKAAVEGFFLLATATSFSDAFKVLDKRFGDSFVVGNAFRDKLDGWSKIDGRDSKGLRRFVDFLKQCEAAMKTIHGLRFLNDDRENRKLLLKLPDWIVSRWGRKVADIKSSKRRFPNFSEFVRFLSNESDIANDPITSIGSLKGDHFVSKSRDVKSGSGASVGKHSRAFAASGGGQESGVSSVKKKCAHCSMNGHLVITCRAFARLSFPEKQEVVKRLRLCYSCLEPGHQSFDCKLKQAGKVVCDTCGKNHLTVMHCDDPQHRPRARSDDPQLNPAARAFNPNNAAVAHDASAEEQPVDDTVPCDGPALNSAAVSLHTSRECQMSSMIVPVYVYHKSNPRKQKMVYALLDSQSNTSFILDSTCHSLSISGLPLVLTLSTMSAEHQKINCHKVSGLVVQGVGSSVSIELPPCFTRPIMPVNRSHIPRAGMSVSTELSSVAKKLLPLANCEVGLLIGYDCAQALCPREVVPSRSGSFGLRTDLGWGIVGTVDCCEESLVSCCHRVLSYRSLDQRDVNVSFAAAVKEEIVDAASVSPREVLKVLESDFRDTADRVGLSPNDQQFIDILSNNIVQLSDGFYQMPLPFKDRVVPLECNLGVAMKRLGFLKGKLESNSDFRDEYVAFMQDMLSQGYCEEVPPSQYDESHAWFIPHHGVYHAVKKKLRVVFDCSARFKGISINDCLLSGPDLTNSLFGVLCRFRKEEIAFMGDVQKMFYRFRVDPSFRDYLRFLWFPNGDTTLSPIQYRMCVMVFGLSSSPGCSNFGFKQLASDYAEEFGCDVRDFIHNDFYVDDGLKSVASVSDAISLVCRSIALCKKGNVKLHKFVSNSRDVLSAIGAEYCADSIRDVDLGLESLPVERALGLEWVVQNDSLRFKVTLTNRPFTRRGLLSTVASVYDPLGFIAPVGLFAKRLLQRLCVDGFGWDDPLPSDLSKLWSQWLSEIIQLRDLEIPRMVKPPGFVVAKVEFHHFCDGSLVGYGFCSYLRLVSSAGDIAVSLVTSKSRVSPIKPTTVPRLELSAAVAAVKASIVLEREFAYSSVSHVFWCDSKVVLSYINNEARRFHLFVANRVAYIHTHTDVCQWRFVPGSKNIADVASRGCSPKELANSAWFTGPSFLYESVVPSFDVSLKTSEDDCEVRKSVSLSTKGAVSGVEDIVARFSSLFRLKKILFLCLQFLCYIRSKVGNSGVVTPADLADVEIRVVREVQAHAFSDEISLLRSGLQLSRKHPLSKLSPFLDSDDVLRVGGRLRHSDLDYKVKHPVLLPKDGHFTRLVIRESHLAVRHSGRGFTLNRVRASGYWIFGGSRAVASFLHSCVACRRLRYATKEQKMADLPSDRVENCAPFTNVGVDFFGPFIVKEGRKELKRYGVIFTCLVSRAVHLEVANALSTSSFLNCLRRFLSIRGPIALLRADRGTNFVGANRELNQAWSEIDDVAVRNFLLENNSLFEFKFNPPSASHFGGVWERLIRSCRSILDGILVQHGTQLDDESLRTYLAEIASILNSRPLTVGQLNDADFLDVLTPNHLLTMKSRVVVAPPGSFTDDDVYSLKRWRRVQYLSDVFWSRFRREYLHLLQTRQKWCLSDDNLQVGDICVLKDESLCRNQWSLCRVDKVYKSDDGLIRSVQICVGDRALNDKGQRVHKVSRLDRPVAKLVFLCRP